MLSLVPTPIGNIGDISLRSIELLSQADILLCEDTRVTKKLIQILKERYNTQFNENQTFISLHSHNEKEFISKLSPEFFEQNVVYVSDAGMPGISDPGQALVAFCRLNAIAYDVLPGANALLTAFVAAGYETTEFLFLGFLDHKGASRAAGLQKALYSGYTTLLYESPHRLEKLLQEMDEIEPTREIFLAKELTKRYQKYRSATPSELLKQLDGNFKGEWVVIIKAAQTQAESAITQKDILELDLPKKVQAKLISKITGENAKACYQRLLAL